MKHRVKKKYYYLQLQEIEKIRNREEKPSLLMHTCCGVCVSWPALYLSEFFKLTLFYNNDNIYPFEEYQRRYDEMVKLVEHYNRQHNTDISIIKTDFKGEEYLKKLQPLKDEPERGRRCQLCYGLRMKEGMRYAAENGFDYFTTVMSISRQKDSEAMNRIGEALQKEYPNVLYFFSDFKKDGGLEKGNQLANEHRLYRQQYCGCLYSYNEYLQRIDAE